MMKSADGVDMDRRSALTDRAILADQPIHRSPWLRELARTCRMEEAMSTTTVREPMRFARQTPSLPTPEEVDAMLQAVNVQLIQHEIAPEPAISPEVCWTIAALTVGGATGCLGAGLLIGGWLSALAGTIVGAAAGGVFAVILWRASDGGGSVPATRVPAYDSASDDLLSGW
jgi:hypothetical protein